MIPIRTFATVAAAVLLGACVDGSDQARAVPDTVVVVDTVAAPGVLQDSAMMTAGQSAMGMPGTAGAGASTGAATPANGVSAQATADAARLGLVVATMRVEVDLTARQLKLFRGTELLATHAVAVGSPEWPTKTGEWTIKQVVWNPEWTPPDESWAEERLPKKPGAKDNPLGRAQLVYDPPRTIHGTNDSTSIGKAVSHGSIRVTNGVATTLARQLMEATGVTKDEAFYTSAQRNRTKKVIVDLPQLVPIRVY